MDLGWVSAFALFLTAALVALGSIFVLAALQGDLYRPADRIFADLAGGTSFLFDGETLVVEKNDAASPPIAITVMLPLFDVSSAAMSIASGGRDMVIRFDPNDLGKVAFAAAPLARGESGLQFERHGREIVFRHRSGPCLGSKRP